MKGIVVIPVGTGAFAVIAMRVTRAFTLPKWQVAATLLVIAVVLYLLNVFLIRHYIRSRVPEFANDQLWEVTAGLGIVPKWVSLIGLLAVSAFIAAVAPWVIAFF